MEAKATIKPDISQPPKPVEAPSAPETFASHRLPRLSFEDPSLALTRGGRMAQFIVDKTNLIKKYGLFRAENHLLDDALPEDLDQQLTQANAEMMPIRSILSQLMTMSEIIPRLEDLEPAENDKFAQLTQELVSKWPQTQTQIRMEGKTREEIIDALVEQTEKNIIQEEKSIKISITALQAESTQQEYEDIAISDQQDLRHLLLLDLTTMDHDLRGLITVPIGYIQFMQGQLKRGKKIEADQYEQNLKPINDSFAEMSLSIKERVRDINIRKNPGQEANLELMELSAENLKNIIWRVHPKLIALEAISGVIINVAENIPPEAVIKGLPEIIEGALYDIGQNASRSHQARKKMAEETGDTKRLDPSKDVILISILLSPDGKFMDIRVDDNGKGIPPVIVNNGYEVAHKLGAHGYEATETGQTEGIGQKRVESTGIAMIGHATRLRKLCNGAIIIPETKTANGKVTGGANTIRFSIVKPSQKPQGETDIPQASSLPNEEPAAIAA